MAPVSNGKYAIHFRQGNYAWIRSSIPAQQVYFWIFTSKFHWKLGPVLKLSNILHIYTRSPLWTLQQKYYYFGWHVKILFPPSPRRTEILWSDHLEMKRTTVCASFTHKARKWSTNNPLTTFVCLTDVPWQMSSKYKNNNDKDDSEKVQTSCVQLKALVSKKKNVNMNKIRQSGDFWDFQNK